MINGHLKKKMHAFTANKCVLTNWMPIRDLHLIGKNTDIFLFKVFSPEMYFRRGLGNAKVICVYATFNNNFSSNVASWFEKTSV